MRPNSSRKTNPAIERVKKNATSGRTVLTVICHFCRPSYDPVLTRSSWFISIVFICVSPFKRADEGKINLGNASRSAAGSADWRAFGILRQWQTKCFYRIHNIENPFVFNSFQLKEQRESIVVNAPHDSLAHISIGIEADWYFSRFCVALSARKQKSFLSFPLCQMGVIRQSKGVTTSEGLRLSAV